ncbi:MAG: DNA repair ATPase [Psychromonas sp.]|nr:DNA repair ATPase [Psychromonas sp.]
MTTPLIISLIALLLIVLIGYNVIQQYKDKLAANLRIATAKQKAIVNEVDELLVNTANIPFSKTLLIIMQQRIRNALLLMLKNSPEDQTIIEHLKNTNVQLSAIRANYQCPSEDVFNALNTDKATIDMLQAAKKICAIIGSEHSKGKIKTDIYVAENYRMEMIQLKIHLQNGLLKIIQANAQKQDMIASNIITKLLKSLVSIRDPDEYLVGKKNQLLKMQNDIKMKATANVDANVNVNVNTENKNKQQKTPEKKDELCVDNIFQNKKKW